MPKPDFEIVKDLQSIGFSEERAQGIIRAIYDIYVANVATKSDLKDLQAELVETREALRAEMTQLATKNELVETRETLRKEMVETRETLRKEMMVVQNRLILWVIGTGLTCLGLGLTIFKLLK